MGRISGSITFGSSFNIATSRPIDSRMRVEYESDLTTGSTWPADEAPVYKGMTVTVMETGDVWVLLDATGYTNPNSWKKVGDIIRDSVTSSATTYSSEKIMTLVGGAGFSVVIVDELPDSGNAMTLYFVPSEESGTSVTYNEWMYINNGTDWVWEQIGDTTIDLSDYYTKEEVDDFIDDKQNLLTASSGINITVDNKISSNSNATTIQEIQLSNGAPVSALGVWPNNKIPSGTSLQEILVKLLCKEMFPLAAKIPYISVDNITLPISELGTVTGLSTPVPAYEVGNFNSSWNGAPQQPIVEGVVWSNKQTVSSITSGFTVVEGTDNYTIGLGSNIAKYTYNGNYTRPSNMPITNLSNSTLSTTGITTDWDGGDLSAVWESGSADASATISVTGVYPCFHNANTNIPNGLESAATHSCNLITGKVVTIDTGEANENDSQRKFMFEFPTGLGGSTSSTPSPKRTIEKFEVWNPLSRDYDDVTTNTVTDEGHSHEINGKTYYYTRVQRTSGFDSATLFKITLSNNLNS